MFLPVRGHIAGESLVTAAGAFRPSSLSRTSVVGIPVAREIKAFHIIAVGSHFMPAILVTCTPWAGLDQ